MRAVYDRSWQLLTPRQAQVLAGLSVFADGFGEEPAREVAGASLDELRELADHSLLQQIAANHYTLPGLLREYAWQRLMQSPEIAQQARGRLDAYRSAELDRWWPDL